MGVAHGADEGETVTRERHVQIGKNQVGSISPGDLESLLCRGRRNHPVAKGLECAVHQVQVDRYLGVERHSHIVRRFTHP
jgi:hypothetical protein